MAEHDNARKQALDGWVGKFGNEAAFVTRLHELEKNPNTQVKRPGDNLIFKFLEQRDASEQLEVQLAGAEGREYRSNSAVTEELGSEPVSDVSDLLAVFQDLYGAKGQQLLSIVVQNGWKVEVRDGEGPISMDSTTKTIIVRKYVDPGFAAEANAYSAGQVCSNRVAASQLMDALNGIFFEPTGFGGHLANEIGNRSLGGTQMAFGTLEAWLGKIAIGVAVGGAALTEGLSLMLVIPGAYMVGHLKQATKLSKVISRFFMFSIRIEHRNEALRHPRCIRIRELPTNAGAR